MNASHSREGPLTEAEEQEIQDYLLQLDMLRQECERAGNFLKAHECVTRMREVNLRHAKRIEAASHQANVLTKAKMAEEHKHELLTFTRMWEEALAEYDQKAQLTIHDMRRAHVADYRAREGALRTQLMARRPRFSKDVVDQRAFLEKLVSQRRYVEAEEVKQRLAALERAELAAFDDALAVEFERKAHALKGQYVNEVQAVEQKIKIGREEMLKERQIEFDKLLRRHENALRALDADTRMHIARTHEYVQRQVKAFVQDPLKTGMDLGGVAKTMRGGRPGSRFSHNASGAATPRGASARRYPGGSTPRATTPPPSSVPRSSRVAESVVDERYGW